MKKGQKVWIIWNHTDEPQAAQFVRFEGDMVICKSGHGYLKPVNRVNVFESRERAFSRAIHRLQAQCISRVAELESKL